VKILHHYLFEQHCAVWQTDYLSWLAETDRDRSTAEMHTYHWGWWERRREPSTFYTITSHPSHRLNTDTLLTHESPPITNPRGRQFKHTHTHIRLTALFPGLLGWTGTRKGKPVWVLLKQETGSGSGISWAVCKSAPRSRQITTPAPHHSSFLQAGCPSCHPTNSVKALKVQGRQFKQASKIATVTMHTQTTLPSSRQKESLMKSWNPTSN